jgi:hypothetical protein
LEVFAVFIVRVVSMRREECGTREPAGQGRTLATASDERQGESGGGGEYHGLAGRRGGREIARTMEAVSTPETPLNFFYQTTERNNTEHGM